jgi:DNA-binding CsgD family transcriptional regulator
MTPEPACQAAGLEAFAGGEPPAFATDAHRRICFWNEGAERLLLRSAERTLGRPCYETLDGRDVFGNRFCHESCALLAGQERGEPARPFELIVPCGAEGSLRVVGITAVRLQNRGHEPSALLHILRPDARASAARAQPARAAPPLSAREQDVLRCIASGLQNKEIAERLLISPATVRNHVHHLLGKLRVHSKLEAASLAHRSGWSGPE